MAEEVRNLAQRSAEAAKNTANMIAESVKNSEEGVKIANNVAKSFEAISGSNAKVDSLIAEIAAASREQAQGIDQVNTAVAQMDKAGATERGKQRGIRERGGRAFITGRGAPGHGGAVYSFAVHCFSII